MSGIIGSKLNIRGSGLVAKLGTDGQVLTSAGAGKSIAYEDLAAGISWQTIETGSTMTAVAGNGYWIDTTSNACTITLPASASAGDTIVFTDYARNWGTNGIVIDSNGLNYQTQDDTYTVEYGTDGTTLAITYMNATQGWVPTIDKTVDDVPVKLNDEGIFGYGWNGSNQSMTNLVSNAGVVATDTTGVGTIRSTLAACSYGEDKGIFGFGDQGTPTTYSAITNLVSNAGVIATDTTGVGTGRYALSATQYGDDKGIFAFGKESPGGDAGLTNISNLVSNTGVVATDTAGVGTARQTAGGCSFK